MPDIDVDAPGTIQLLMGNEAIARGALEGGIGFASSYPGTPASEILPAIAEVAKRMNIYAEWSVNEKVAMEAAAGASFAGIRSLVAMKANGLNVACDFLANLQMTGIGGGIALVVCDDPGSISSTNEQYTGIVGKWMGMPLLEPSSAQEAKDMTKWALDISEEVGLVCMVRSVTRVSHTRGNVKLGELPKNGKKAYFSDLWDMYKPKMSGFSAMGSALPRGWQHHLVHQKLAKVPEKFEASPFNWYVGPDKAELLIITTGSCWPYSLEAVKELKLEDKVGILKLGTTWPLPEKLVEKQLSRTRKILFVEEIEPFIEGSVMELVANLPSGSPHLTFYGKRSGHMKAYGDYDPVLVANVIASIMSVTYQPRDSKYGQKIEELAKVAPIRTMQFCPGCPYRAAFWTIKDALKVDGRDGFVTGDIGCYTLGNIGAGYFQVRTHSAMGSGAGVANGLGNLRQFGFNQPVLAMCGDSTFYHAAIPALINGIWNDSNFILIMMDNSTTAMTGHQPHPGTGTNVLGEPAKAIDMEALCRSLGARVEVCDPFDLKNTTSTLLELMAEGGGAKVLIIRRECELVRARKEKKAPYQMRIDTNKCIGEDCGCNRVCTRLFQCPGLAWDKEAGKAKIDEAICAGCGLCADICPQGAIIKERVS